MAPAFQVLPGTTGRRRLYLMRHGHVDYFGPEIQASGGDSTVVPLTELGRAQATAAGEALAHVSLDRAMSSGLTRTRQTAEIVLRGQKTEKGAPVLETEPDLAEIHGGQPLTPITSRADLSARMTFSFETATAPGARMMETGEPFADAEHRALAAIRRLLAEPGWHTTLIVAHEGINRILLGWAALGGDGSGLAACRAFEQDPACINVIDFDLVPAEREGGPVEIQRTIVKSVNMTPYNYVKHGMNMTSLEAIFAET